MRTMETLEIGLNPEELDSLVNGQSLQIPIGENERMLLYAAVQPEEPPQEQESPSTPDEISEGQEVEQ